MSQERILQLLKDALPHLQILFKERTLLGIRIMQILPPSRHNLRSFYEESMQQTQLQAVSPQLHRKGQLLQTTMIIIPFISIHILYLLLVASLCLLVTT